MKKNSKTALGISLCLGLAISNIACAQTTHRPQLAAAAPAVATPFQNNNGQVPTPQQYSGPLFSVSHAWPQKALPPLANPPWQTAIKGQQITTENASAYAYALREYVSKNAKTLILDYPNWNAAKAGWFNEPWLGSEREAIRGTYAAGEFGPAIFPDTGLRATFNTHVLTYYDERAAYTLFKMWGASAMTPDIKTANGQFEEGAVIVKAAVFASTDPKQKTDWWDAMKGASVWSLFIDQSGNNQPPQVWPGYVAQFDIIVKDTKSSPITGWVFTTLVYDASAPGDAWDKMIPLGAQWGNDPQATQPGQPLVENWINPKAPKYSTQTLGWGGRLSGPNDGARNNIAVNGKVEINAPDSSCMSCHSTAQWNVAKHRMDSFLLPSFSQDAPPGFQLCNDQGKRDPNGQNICSPAPASPEWMKWFQNRPGTEPMDAGSVAMDFDEVFSFKSLPLWYKATSGGAQVNPKLLKSSTQTTRFNQYTGAPLKDAGNSKK
ncbi:MAG TPA: hypothetical protein VL995_14760 [Cellvibrio sp.]|nr:hypothetical protein [Cellvibrio sp.]